MPDERDLQQLGQVHSGSIQATPERAFLRGSDDPPQPQYTNNVDFTASGMDVFMDVGTVAPEAVRKAMTAGEKLPAVRFNVDFRFGMSIQTAAVMLQRLAGLVQAAAAQGPPSVLPQSSSGSAPETLRAVGEESNKDA
jgi:hypothetical protein